MQGIATPVIKYTQRYLLDTRHGPEHATASPGNCMVSVWFASVVNTEPD